RVTPSCRGPPWMARSAEQRSHGVAVLQHRPGSEVSQEIDLLGRELSLQRAVMREFVEQHLLVQTEAHAFGHLRPPVLRHAEIHPQHRYRAAGGNAEPVIRHGDELLGEDWWIALVAARALPQPVAQGG